MISHSYNLAYVLLYKETRTRGNEMKMTYSQLSSKIRERNAAVAHGSESCYWQDYYNDIIRLGASVESDSVPHPEVVEYWLTAWGHDYCARCGDRAEVCECE